MEWVNALSNSLREMRLTSIDTVMLCAGAWGDTELPTTLDEFIAFTKSRWMERPYPAFFLRLLDELREAEVGMTCCKCNTGELSFIRQSFRTMLTYVPLCGRSALVYPLSQSR